MSIVTRNTSIFNQSLIPIMSEINLTLPPVIASDKIFASTFNKETGLQF